MCSWEISFAHSEASCVVYSTKITYTTRSITIHPFGNTQCSFGSVRATLVIEKKNNPNFYSQFSALAFTVSVIAALIIKQKYISHTRRRVGVRRQIHTCVCVCALRFHSCVSVCRPSCAFFEFSCWRRATSASADCAEYRCCELTEVRNTFTRMLAICLSIHWVGWHCTPLWREKERENILVFSPDYSHLLASLLCASVPWFAWQCPLVLPLCMSIKLIAIRSHIRHNLAEMRPIRAVS